MVARILALALLAAAIGACGAAAPIPEVRIGQLTGLSEPVGAGFRRSLQTELERTARRGPATPGCVLEASARTDDRGRVGVGRVYDAVRIDVRVDLLLECPGAEPRQVSAQGTAVGPMGTIDPEFGRSGAVAAALDDAARIAVRRLSAGEP